MTIFLILLGIYFLGLVPSWLMLRKCVKDIEGFNVYEEDLVLIFFPLANIAVFFFIAFNYLEETDKEKDFINKIFLIKDSRSK